MILRDYQQDIFNKTKMSFATGHRAPLICAPCGSGKTVIFSYFTKTAVANNNDVLILSHREELVEQISNTLNEFSVKHSFCAAGRWYDPADRVHVGSVQTVVKRLDRIKPPTFIIADECHHVIAQSTWGTVLKRFPEAHRVGVTATPSRLSGEPLDMFDDLILGPSMRELIDQGHLSDYKIFVPSKIDVSGLHSRGGDFFREELVATVDKPSITGCAISEYKKYANGKRAIAYCVSVAHAEHVAQQFRAAGIVAVSIDGTINKDTRKDIIHDYRNGKIQILTNCDLVSEGFDLPAIECGIMLRPTQSLALWIQQSGRALRKMDGKPYAILLDHAGNAERHGLPDDDREWTLAGRKKTSKKTGERELSVRVCPSCFAAQKSGMDRCVFCGYVYPVESRVVDEKDGDLVELERLRERKELRMEQGRCQSLAELHAFAKQHGKSSGWAWYVWNARKSKQAKNYAGVEV